MTILAVGTHIHCIADLRRDCWHEHTVTTQVKGKHAAFGWAKGGDLHLSQAGKDLHGSSCSEEFFLQKVPDPRCWHSDSLIADILGAVTIYTSAVHQEGMGTRLSK